jgi:hypothetical protein
VVGRAKNLPPDPRTLLQRLMWITLIVFLRPSGGRAGDGTTMACGRARGQVQIYDVRFSSSVRRPAVCGAVCKVREVKVGGGGGIGGAAGGA